MIGLSIRLQPRPGVPTTILSLASGSFTLDGQGAAFAFAPAVAASAASFALLGGQSGYARAGTIGATSGLFTESGQAASLLKGSRVAGAFGSFAETGQAATLSSGKKIVASRGSFAETGQAATLTYTSNSPYEFDFTSTAPGTYTRSGTQYYVNSSGNMASAAADTAAWDHNPSTLAKIGMLWERGQTNEHTNPTFATTTGVSGATDANGIDWTVTGGATEDGVPGLYLDWTTGAGTTSASGTTTINLHSATAVPATAGETGDSFTCSIYTKLVSGTLTGFGDEEFRVAERNAAGAFVGSNTALDLDPTSAKATTQRRIITHTLAHADAVRPQMLVRLPYSSGASMSGRLFIGAAQCEPNVTGASSFTVGTRGVPSLALALPNGDYDATVKCSTVSEAGTSYEAPVTVSQGRWMLQLPADAVAAGERHILDAADGASLAQTAAGSSPLAAPWDFETIFNAQTAVDSGTAISTASRPNFTYDTTDKLTWDNWAHTVHTAADEYFQGTKRSATRGTSIRDQLMHVVSNDYMRINASTSYSSGTASDYVSERNWATIAWAWVYLKTRFTGIYSAADRVAIEAWFLDICADIRWYYDFPKAASDSGSKHNNHAGFAHEAMIMAAVCGYPWVHDGGAAAVAQAGTAQDWVERAVAWLRHLMYDKMTDRITNSGTSVPLLGYNDGTSSPTVDGTNLLPPGILMMDLDRPNSTTQHNGWYYNLYHFNNLVITALFARANGFNLFTETVHPVSGATPNGTIKDMIRGYHAVCADSGADVWAFLAANQSDRLATDASHLRVDTIKDDNEFASLGYLTVLSELTGDATLDDALATITTNLVGLGHTNSFSGQDVDFLRGYLS